MFFFYGRSQIDWVCDFVIFQICILYQLDPLELTEKSKRRKNYFLMFQNSINWADASFIVLTPHA